MRHSVLFLMLNFSAHFTDKKQKSTKFKGNFVVFFSAPTSYNSDHHRYNMKRRVASLPPISIAVFNQKVLEKRTNTIVVSSNKSCICDICRSVRWLSHDCRILLIASLQSSKVYTTENAFRSH